MTQAQFVRLLRRNWLMAGVITLIAAIVALTYSQLEPRTYVATAKVFVSTSAATSSSDLTQSGAYAQQVVRSYADFATTSFVLRPVIARLNIPETPQQLATRVSVSVPPEEVILNIQVTDDSPVRAADIANSVAGELGSATVAIAPNARSALAMTRVTTVQQATAPVTPSSPRTSLDVVFGVLVGLVLSIVIALLRARFDDRVWNMRDAAEATGVPVLAGLTTAAWPPSASRRYSATALNKAAYTDLVDLIVRAGADRAPSVVGLTSSSSSDSAQDLGQELARTMETVGVQVTSVDAEALLQPGSSRQRGQNGGGPKRRLGSPRRSTSGSEVALKRPSSGGAQSDGEARDTGLLDALRGSTSVVLVDLPPVLEPQNDQVDALIAQMDLVVVACVARRSTRTALRRSVRLLRARHVEILGVVVAGLLLDGPESSEPTAERSSDV